MRSLVLLVTLGALSACTSYRIRSAEDHGAMRVTKIEMVRVTNSFFWAEVEHQYWLCQDASDELVCHRACGGGQDVQCPTTVASDGAFTSNTR